MPDDTLHAIGSLDGITATIAAIDAPVATLRRAAAECGELAAQLAAIGGDCTRCAVRDANCCALAECPFLKVCPVFKTITGNGLREREAGDGARR